MTHSAGAMLIVTWLDGCRMICCLMCHEPNEGVHPHPGAPCLLEVSPS